MALESVVFPQIAEDQFSYAYKDLYSMMSNNSTSTGWMSYDDFAHVEEDQDSAHNASNSYNNNWVSSPSMLHQQVNDLELTSSSPENCTAIDAFFPATHRGFSSGELPANNSGIGTTARRKRRRTKSCKNKEEVENQRMTHIAVERNRRKQMNDYLSVLRSLMPASYVQRVINQLINHISLIYFILLRNL